VDEEFNEFAINQLKEVSKLKQEPGKDIAIVDSSNLAVTLAEHGLIDKYRIIINPVFLGEGTTLLKGLKKKINLKLLKARMVNSRNVLLTTLLRRIGVSLASSQTTTAHGSGRPRTGFVISARANTPQFPSLPIIQDNT